MQTMQGRDQGLTGPTRFTGGKAFGTGRLSGAVPALSLNFLAGALANNLTFSRSTNATMFDSQGRLVWAPANMLLRSDDPTTGWTNTDTTPTLTGDTSPSGAPGYLMTEGSAGTALSLQATTGALATAQYCFALEVKRGNNQYLRLRIGNGSDTVSAWVNFDAGTITAATVAGVSVAGIQPTISNLGGGWYLVSVSGNTSTVLTAVLTNTSPTSGATTRVSDGSYIIGRRTVTLLGADSPKLPLQATIASQYFGPRFDYNPSTLAIRGLLIEEARSNTLAYSRDLSQALWTKTDITVAQTVTDISNVASSTYLVTEGLAGTALMHAGGVVAAGATLSASIVLKSTGGSPVQWVRLLCRDGALTDGYDAWFDILNGVLGTVSAAGAGTSGSASIVSLGGGWYRCAVSCVPNAVYTTGRVAVNSAAGNGSGARVASATYAADHAQVEAGAFATSLIPTYGTAAARARDILSAATAGWWNAAGPNSWYCEVMNMAAGAAAAGPARFMLNDGTSNNRFGHWISSLSRSQVANGIGGVQTFTPLCSTAQSIGAVEKIAGCAADNDVVLVDKADGAVLRTDTSYAIASSTFNSLAIGSTPLGQSLNGWMRKLSFYPSRLTNTQLQGLVA